MLTVVPTWTLLVRPSSVTEPTGMTVPLSCSREESWAGVRPAAASFFSSGSITTWRSVVPVTVTSRTCAMPDSSGTSTESIVSVSSCSVPSPETASWITGRSSNDPAMTSGSTSSGRSWMLPIADVISWLASSMSVPYSSSTVVIEMPVPTVDVTPVTPSMPWTAVSTGSVTRSDTISGEVPG